MEGVTKYCHWILSWDDMSNYIPIHLAHSCRIEFEADDPVNSSWNIDGIECCWVWYMEWPPSFLLGINTNSEINSIVVDRQCLESRGRYLGNL